MKYGCKKNLKLDTELAAGTIKLFKAVINYVLQKARAFDTFSHFHPSLKFEGKTGSYTSGAYHVNPRLTSKYLSRVKGVESDKRSSL